MALDRRRKRSEMLCQRCYEQGLVCIKRMHTCRKSKRYSQEGYRLNALFTLKWCVCVIMCVYCCMIVSFWCFVLNETFAFSDEVVWAGVGIFTQEAQVAGESSDKRHTRRGWRCLSSRRHLWEEIFRQDVSCVWCEREFSLGYRPVLWTWQYKPSILWWYDSHSPLYHHHRHLLYNTQLLKLITLALFIYHQAFITIVAYDWLIWCFFRN